MSAIAREGYRRLGERVDAWRDRVVGHEGEATFR